MLTKEIIKQVRQIEIKTRGVVNEVFSGEYHSVFKGRGMEFSEVREYQIGDDIRSIDWNVTARLGHPYIKVFEEERELTLILLVDLSGSQKFGSGRKTKQQIATEISAILAFSALKNNDKVGLILFSDTIEKFVPPRKGKSHVLRIIREVLSFEAQGSKTSIKTALEFFNSTVKKRAIVFLISDFIDVGYEKILKIVSKKHDLVSLILKDKRELDIPPIGLVSFMDNETGNIRLLDTSDKKVQAQVHANIQEQEFKLKQLFKTSGIDSVYINKEDYLKSLIEFFKLREKRW
jgi:uncharacterized protein (DUF58 family)